MFGLGMSEIVMILVLALVVIGPKKLPEVAKALGKGYGEFKRAMTDFKDAVNVEFDDQEKKEAKSDLTDIYENKWKDDLKNTNSKLDDNMDKYIETETTSIKNEASDNTESTKTSKETNV